MIRGICEDTLRRVYDFCDMTDEELRCKFFQKLQECIDLCNNTNEIVEWIKNEGLEKEVNELLNTWLEDGTLDNERIEIEVKKLLEQWLNDGSLDSKIEIEVKKLLELWKNDGTLENTIISTTLDKYEGNTLNDKMVAMFNDINTNHKNTPMQITLPDGIIEITSNLTARNWTNKVLICNGYLYYNNCNAIEFIQCMHNNIYIHASSNSNLDIESGNILGLISPSSTTSLTKRGYKITDCSYNEFKFNNIIGFTNAIEVYSEYGAKGTFYNNIYFTAIWRCQRPMIFRTGKASDDSSGQSGWITEIYVHGGMFDCDDGILIGQEVGNRPTNEPTDNYQGLKFYNVGVEHVRKKDSGIGFYFAQGKNNAVINPRFEGSLLTGNSTSGAYILVKESGYACNNRIETSNFPVNVDRIQLNYLAKQLANPNYDNPAGSYIEGELYDNNGFKCGYKAIATPGKMVYEAKNLSNYYLNSAKNNTFNYTYSDTEYAKIKCSDGTIKTIGYTS